MVLQSGGANLRSLSTRLCTHALRPSSRYYAMNSMAPSSSKCSESSDFQSLVYFPHLRLIERVSDIDGDMDVLTR